MHAVLFVYQRAFTPELIMQRPVRLRVGTPEFLGPVLRGPAVFFYRLLTKTPLPQPHVRSGRHYGNLLPSSPIIQRCGVRPFGYEDGLLFAAPHQVSGQAVALTQYEIEQMVERVVRDITWERLPVQVIPKRSREV
jgi:hypothetical protein